MNSKDKVFERLKTLLTDTMIVQFALIEYLVHGVFGDDLEASQSDSIMHEHNGDRPHTSYFNMNVAECSQWTDSGEIYTHSHTHDKTRN